VERNPLDATDAEAGRLAGGRRRASLADPSALAARYGIDALRWWFLRDVRHSGDADFREELRAAVSSLERGIRYVGT
jgi:isoleucyl-tRNA synthetase